MAHTHSEVTDQLDEGASTATILMRGLGLFCFNEQGAFEGGFVRLPSHKYMIEVKQSGAELSSPSLRITDLEGDIDIRVVNPARAGAHRFERGTFDRTADTSDPRDFRWILDIEGPEMHAEEVAPSGRMQGEGGKRLSRLNISDGTFYTKKKSLETYARVRTDDETAAPQFLGRIADKIGVEIECADDDDEDSSERTGILITINNGAKTEIFLPKQSGVKYDLTFSNDCPEPVGEKPDSTDFRVFYDIIRDSTGKEFDLALAVDPDDPKAADGVPLDEAATKFRDGYGLVCDQVYMGKTSSLSGFPR